MNGISQNDEPLRAIMRSKWPLRGFEPQFFIFEEKI
jgi:hypothetical protein